MAAACVAGLPPGLLFGPEDEVAVEHYLLPRLLGWALPVDGLILDDDPLSAPPRELLERNGRREEAFFFAEGQARCGKGTCQKRTCAGGGWWEGQKTCAEGDKLRVPGIGGGEAAWRKKALNFHCGGAGRKGSTGWVMHEYAVTAPEDLARSPLRLYHIRLSSYGRKQSGAMEVPHELGLPPGFVFAPEDGDVVACYLLPRVLGQPLPMDGLILDDDPLSAPPWELLERNGRRDDAFFFALGQVRSSKGSRQKRTCAGGGFWNGERTCVDGEKLLVPGLGGAEVVEWRKRALSFQHAGDRGSTGWVMHEYAITAPDHLAESHLRLYRIRFSGHGKKRKRAEADPSADESADPTAARRRVAEDDTLLGMLMPMPSSDPICSSLTTVLADNADGNADAEDDTLLRMLIPMPSSDPISSSTELADQADGNGVNPICSTASASEDLTSGMDTYWDGFLENLDINELLRSIGDLSSPDLLGVLPAVTGPGAYLDADAEVSSFFTQTTAAAAPPYVGFDAGLVAPSASGMHHGCTDRTDSFVFPPPNQSYAAC